MYPFSLRAPLSLVLVVLSFSVFGQTANICQADFAYRSAPWKVRSSVCYIVNKSINPLTQQQPGWHQNIICQASFNNCETGEIVNFMANFGYGGGGDDYSGDNLGGHGIDATKYVPPTLFFSTADSLCQLTQGFENAMNQGEICYSLLGNSYCGRVWSNLGAILTCQPSHVGAPTFNCRDVAQWMWNYVPITGGGADFCPATPAPVLCDCFTEIQDLEGNWYRPANSWFLQSMHQPAGWNGEGLTPLTPATLNARRDSLCNAGLGPSLTDAVMQNWEPGQSQKRVRCQNNGTQTVTNVIVLPASGSTPPRIVPIEMN